MTTDDIRTERDDTAAVALDPERMRRAQERGANHLFIPRHLAVEGRPELANFPLNVLFVSYRVVHGIRETGEALYEPDLSTFTESTTAQSMTYRNEYGDAGVLRISFDVLARQWHGEKCISGKVVDEVTASEWRSFFLNFTALGLMPGEPCQFTSD